MQLIELHHLIGELDSRGHHIEQRFRRFQGELQLNQYEDYLEPLLGKTY